MPTSKIFKLVIIIFSLTFSSFFTPSKFLFSAQITSSAIAQNTDEIKTKANQMEEDAISFFQAGRVEEAISLMENSLNLYRQLKDEKQQRRVLDNFGSLYISIQNYPKAIESLRQSLILAQKLENLEAQQSSLFKLARSHRELNNNQQAEKYYQKAYQVSISLNDSQGKMIALGSLGQIYEESQNFDQAIVSYTQAKDIARQIQDQSREKLALKSLAKIYLTRGWQKYQAGDRTGARQDIQQSANFLEQQGDKETYDRVQQMLQHL